MTRCNATTLFELNTRRPARQKPLPTPEEPNREAPQRTPQKTPERKKKSIYEIVIAGQMRRDEKKNRKPTKQKL